MEDQSKEEQLIFRLIKAFGILLLALFLLGAFFLFETINAPQYEKDVDLNEEEQKEEKPEEEFELKNAKEVSFEWTHNNRNYTLDTTLYDSLYNYYNSLSKKYTCVGTCPENWEEDYYNMFLKVKKEDNTFSEITSNLEEIGNENKMSDDQIVELAVSFVQSIPYDTEGASGEISLARYPYQVLYEKKGLCSGKSFLGVLLVKELGYGVALFGFDKEQHMVIGIKCPQDYSSYNSGYCYTELTTPGWKIGIENFDDIENITSTSRTPSIEGAPQIYKVADGKTYYGIYETIEQKEKIKKLKKEIDQLNYRMESLKEELNYYEKIGDYKKYNNIVTIYNNLISEHSEKIKVYNKLIEDFSPGK